MAKKILPFAALVLLVALGCVAWWLIQTSPVNSAEQAKQTFIISKGENVREIAADLKSKGLIRDEWAFLLVSKKLGIEKNLQAGSFHLSKAMSTAQIAEDFTVGTEDEWITIPEGWRSEQIVDYLKTQGIDSQLGNWKLEEGRYFPDTYLVPKTSTIDDVRQLMRKNFDNKTAGLNLSEKDLIIASMVEREAKAASDRPLVASVILNRLSIGMKLDIDATVQYAVGFTSQDGWWKKNLTLQDLAVQSPYNTYTNPGLPPAPICDPGLSSIEAVLNPAETDYLYYLTDKDGNMHYSTTLEEHNANRAKYLGL